MARPTRPKSPAPDAKPGGALRALRTARGWTLAEVAQRTGLPISSLSKIENDRMSLSYDKLTRLCAGLEIDIAELFAADTASAAPKGVAGRRSITRAGEGRAIDTSNYRHLYPAADLLNKRFVPIIAEPRARSLAEFGELIRHPGEEYACVMEGVVELHTDLYAPVRLEAGDSIYFDSSMGHAYIAVGRGTCRVLSVCSDNETQLIEAMAEPRKLAPVTVSKQATKPGRAAAKVAPKRQTVKPKGRSRAGKS
jgi:transcriptional regulator with XRE-family HTH domain